MAGAKALLKNFNNLKTLPHLAIRLTQMLSEDTGSLAEFEEVIKMDPTLVLRLMRLVNSPYYGLRQKAESISDALVYIGMKNLRNMVVMEALKDIFKEGAEGDKFSTNQLWLHCAAVSIASQLIAERIFEMKGEDAFLCGILHDIGMIVEVQVEPERFFEAVDAYQPDTKPFTKIENEIIGANHCEVGYLLACDWKFPAEVANGIRNHHKEKGDVAAKSILGILHIAEYMVGRMDLAELSGMKANLPKSLLLHIRENIEEYKALGAALPEEMAKAREMYDLES